MLLSLPTKKNKQNKKKRMKIELHQTVPYPLSVVREALIMIREHQAEPNVTFTPLKTTEAHTVHQIDYKVPFLLTPFVGSSVVLREDTTVLGNHRLSVTTQSEGYATKTCPFMFTETVYHQPTDGVTEMRTLVHYGIMENGVQWSRIDRQLEEFGKKRYEEIVSLQSEFCDRVLMNS